MSGEVVLLPAVAEALQTLHSEIERLAVHAISATPMPGPIGVTNNGLGEEMLVFYDADHIKVFVCNGTVFISGIEHFGYWPDWFCLPRPQARAIARALLAASATPEPEEDQP